MQESAHKEADLAAVEEAAAAVVGELIRSVTNVTAMDILPASAVKSKIGATGAMELVTSQEIASKIWMEAQRATTAISRVILLGNVQIRMISADQDFPATTAIEAGTSLATALMDPVGRAVTTVARPAI